MESIFSYNVTKNCLNFLKGFFGILLLLFITLGCIQKFKKKIIEIESTSNNVSNYHHSDHSCSSQKPEEECWENFIINF